MREADKLRRWVESRWNWYICTRNKKLVLSDSSYPDYMILKVMNHIRERCGGIEVEETDDKTIKEQDARAEKRIERSKRNTKIIWLILFIFMIVFVFILLKY